MNWEEEIALIVITMTTCIGIGTGVGMVIRWYFNF